MDLTASIRRLRHRGFAISTSSAQRQSLVWWTELQFDIRAKGAVAMFSMESFFSYLLVLYMGQMLARCLIDKKRFRAQNFTARGCWGRDAVD